MLCSTLAAGSVSTVSANALTRRLAIASRAGRNALWIVWRCAGARCKAQRTESIQLADLVHPSQRPTRQLGMGVGQFQEVPALMGPAEREQHTRMQSGKLRVRRVPVATDHALTHAGHVAFDHRSRTRLIQHAMQHRTGMEHPQVPAMTDLAGEFGASSLSVERNSRSRGWSGPRGTVCGRVKAGHRPPEGLGLDAVGHRETLAEELSANAFLAGNPDGRGRLAPFPLAGRTGGWVAAARPNCDCRVPH